MKKKSILAIAALLTFGQVAWAQSFTETETEKGTAEKPFLIESIEDLNALAADVNSGTDYSGVYFQLTDDLDYSGVSLCFDLDEDGNYDSNFTPIGCEDNNPETFDGDYPFNGIFNGGGNTISGITIDQSDGLDIGIFGYILGATIKNLTLADCSFSGNMSVGSILGATYPTPNNLIENCHVTASVEVNGDTYVGGIVGYIDAGTVKNCACEAEVTGADGVGGIAGQMYETTIEDCFYTGSSVFNGATKGIITGDRGDSENPGLEGTIKLTLFNDDTEAAINNATRLIYYNAIEDVDVILSGRTLSKSQWNTLCLPFSMDATQIAASSLNGATIKELDTENSNLAANGTLKLTFSDVSSITAGKPYIVKWGAGDDISDPVFKGVTIDKTAPAAVTFTNNANDNGGCEFVGQYSPFSITDGNKNEIIMLGSGSKLGYSKNERTLKCFRAHFYVPANGGGALARAFVMDFGDGETTEIIGATADQRSTSATYTLDGRRINDLPTQKGMYIQNGRKVIIK